MTLGAQALGPETDRTPDLRKHTRYFATYEAREAAVAARTAALVPRKHAGPRVVWEDFGRIRGSDLSARTDSRQVVIGSNPRECLAFGTPRQVLTAARLGLGQNQEPGDAPDVETAARRFEIFDTLDQPLRTLSGGETLILC